MDKQFANSLPTTLWAYKLYSFVLPSAPLNVDRISMQCPVRCEDFVS